jgi:glucokinase
MKKSPLVIGTDIGGTNLRVGIVNNKGKVLKKTKRPVSEDVLNELVEEIEALREEGPFSAIGLGVAGVVDRGRGIVVRSPNLPQINGVPFVKALQERFSLPVFIENDANAHALGEAWLGAGKKFKSFVLLTLGTGIGGGVVHKGQLLDIAAELGHITVEGDGPQCACGNNGCLETFASATAVVTYVVDAIEQGQDSVLKQAHRGNFYRITAEEVYKAALDGDGLARAAIKRAGRYLGIGVASLINIFSPEAVVIGGGLSGAWQLLAPEMIKELEKRAFPELVARVKVRRAELSDDAGLLGAARLALIGKK